MAVDDHSMTQIASPEGINNVCRKFPKLRMVSGSVPFLLVAAENCPEQYATYGTDITVRLTTDYRVGRRGAGWTFVHHPGSGRFRGPVSGRAQCGTDADTTDTSCDDPLFRLHDHDLCVILYHSFDAHMSACICPLHRRQYALQ